MIKYPADYFEDEIRCGFRITAMMKRNWASQMEVLAEFERICNKYDLKYFAFAGTLLGAVRHKGFIPWDDDLDVAMKRSDYMKLMNVIVQEMPSDFWVNTIYNAADWDNTFARVVNTESIPLKGEKLERFHGAPFATGLDIFPMDYLPKDPELVRVQKQLVDLADKMIVNLIKNKLGHFDKGGEEAQEKIKAELSESFKIFAEFGAIPSSLEGKSILQIFELIYDQLCMLGGEDGDKCVFFHTINRSGYKDVFDSKLFEEVFDMPFEYGTIKVPVGYDEFLKTAFGNDYMKYARTGVAHHYPVYQGQMKRLIDGGLWNEPYDLVDIGIVEEKEDIYDEQQEKSWKKLLDEQNTEGKKVILFETLVTSLLRWEERYLDVLEKMLDMLCQSDKFFIWWRPFINERTPYRDIRPELFERYHEIYEKYQKSNNILIDTMDTAAVAIKLCDAFLGDASAESDNMLKNKKKSYLVDMTTENPESVIKKIK